MNLKFHINLYYICDQLTKNHRLKGEATDNNLIELTDKNLGLGKSGVTY